MLLAVRSALTPRPLVRRERPFAITGVLYDAAGLRTHPAGVWVDALILDTDIPVLDTVAALQML